ncbi:hypothetical protein [Sphingopyxis sp. USTB-05]|uniref:hypothetical protein n=1 Tax=Sphingopyxis sp. USTB-05 TaxID=2830667 RepID=UPI0020786A8D|nr:hypothetical protein [Sphingopyxis sp. USTB-05]USI79079.1 hypothetical protein KEC45_09400 [Sphingopyxis sp. USTB-05]
MANELENWANLAIDYWKLLRSCERISDNLSGDRSERFAAQVRFSSGRLAQHLSSLEVELATFEGQIFGPEIPAVAINHDEFDDAEPLVVDKAIEPAIICKGQVIHSARVAVKKAENNVSRN